MTSILSYKNYEYQQCIVIFFRKLSQNPEYVQTHCNDRNTPFHFVCRKKYLYNNSTMII